MSDFASISGQRVVAARGHFPGRGVWYLDVDLDQQVSLSGAVTATIGDLTLKGTIAPEFSGAYVLASRFRVVGGAYGWQKPIAALSYHNDLGVKTATVLEDAARAAGETITILPGAVPDRLGVDFVREYGPASQVFSQLGVEWWVGNDGVTVVGARTSSAVSVPFDVIDFDPREHVVTLGTLTPGGIVVGSTITDPRLPAPQLVRSLGLEMTDKGLRLECWTAEALQEENRLLRALKAVVRWATPKADFSVPYRYRVFGMTGNRVNLQAVRKGAGLPDLLSISMRPGIAGAWANLTPGSLVLVTFIEGDPTLPIVTHFEDRDGPGWRPVDLYLDASNKVRIGSGSYKPVARLGDGVSGGTLAVIGSGVTLQYTPPGGTPGTPTTSVTLQGSISQGSGKVEVE